MVLQLNAALQQQLDGWAREAYPLECCGLLLGHDGDGVVRVEEVMRMRNSNTQRGDDRYEIDAQDLLHADAHSRQHQLEIVGVWHTHPDHPARPSATDREQAWDGWSYLILSVSGAGVQALRSWRLCGPDFAEEEVHT
jgi:proteasome lid subunit RPN8/RPN11